MQSVLADCRSRIARQSKVRKGWLRSFCAAFRTFAGDCRSVLLFWGELQGAPPTIYGTVDGNVLVYRTYEQELLRVDTPGFAELGGRRVRKAPRPRPS